MIGKTFLLALTSCATGALVVIGARSLTLGQRLQALPRLSVEQIERAQFNSGAVSLPEFSGTLRRPTGAPDWIGLRWRAENRCVRLILRFGRGEGEARFYGIIPADRGEVRLGPMQASMNFRPFFHLIGSIHGPAMVDGRPTVYMKIRAAMVDWSSADPQYRWEGLLRWEP